MKFIGRNADAADYLGRRDAGLLWRTIAAEGLDANDFQVDGSELPGYVWKLSHKPTGQALHASANLKPRNTSYVSYADLLRTRPDGDVIAYKKVADRGSYIFIVRHWADELKAAKPVRGQHESEPTAIGSADDQAGENTPFTPAERTEILNQIRAIRDSARKNYRLSAEQLAAIDKRLEEAEEASKRLGRKDWKSLFYGVVFGLIVNDAIPPDVAQHIFTGVLHGITHLLGGGAPPGPWMLGR
jgi:hypothetical protein